VGGRRRKTKHVASADEKAAKKTKTNCEK